MSCDEKRDVVIIGGRLAGLSAAISVKRHHPDLDTLILERGSIGERVNCGEGIDGETFAALDMEDIYYPRGGHRVDAFEFLLKRGKRRVTFRGENLGYNIERDTAEMFMWVAAEEEGVETWTRARVTDVTLPLECLGMQTRKNPDVEGRVRVSGVMAGEEDFVVRARHVIDASGPACVVARTLGWREWAPPKREEMVGLRNYLVRCEAEPHVNVFDLRHDGGYGWIFPKGRGLANIGCGFHDGRPGWAAEAVTSILMGMVGAGPDDVVENRSGTINMNEPHLHVADPTGHIALAGEAGNIVNMPGGAGNALALVTGYAAGKHVTYLQDYDKWYQWQLYANLMKGYERKKKVIRRGNPCWTIKAGAALHRMFPRAVERRVLRGHRIWGDVADL